MNVFIKMMKRVVPLEIRKKISQTRGYYRHKDTYLHNVNCRKVYLIGSPEHNNLGDHAIAYAISEFVKDILPEYHFTDISLNMFNSHLNCLRKYITEEDVIVLIGGGNFGNEYLFEEDIRRTVIESFSGHPLLVFPQTIFFTEDGQGRTQLSISKRIYARHPNLTLAARENVSFERMKREFPRNNVILAPDIVMYLNKTEPRLERSGALLCFRNDREGIISQSNILQAEECCKKFYSKIQHTDTCTSSMISLQDRNRELDEKLREFKQAELVITDRLHGMVFAAITSTPCIALGNYNHKVLGTYKWLQHLKYIRYINNIDELEAAIESLYNAQADEFDNEFALQYFYRLAHVLRQGEKMKNTINL